MSILAVGSVAYDEIETPFGSSGETLGGSAVYFALAARLFTQVRIVGVVGEDFDERHVKLLEERGIDVRGLERAPGRTFRWAGRYAFDMNTRETLATELNVFERFHPQIPQAYRDSELLFLGNIDPILQLDVMNQVPDARLTACDTMNYWIVNRRDDLARLLERVDVLVANDEEIRQYSGTPNLRRAAGAIRAAGPDHVVIKKGEHGALLFGPRGIFAAPGLPLEETTDPTGAGDAFAGGFLGALAERPGLNGTDFRTAVIYGCVLGSLCVEAFGVNRLLDLTRDEVEERFRTFRELMECGEDVAVSGRVRGAGSGRRDDAAGASPDDATAARKHG